MLKFKIEYLDIIKSFEIEDFYSLKETIRSKGGKSGAFFFFTPDREFILKTITREELHLFDLIINDYSNRIFSEQGSILAKIFSIFKIKFLNSPSIIIMIMENISNQIEDPFLFDMKGSSGDRQVSHEKFENLAQMSKSLVYKDIDFIDNIGSLSIEYCELEKLINIVSADTKILEENIVMDYSLLLIIGQGQYFNSKVFEKMVFNCNGLIVYVGIIDFLQGYNIGKKLENKYKNFGGELRYSAVPPKQYRERFLKMIRTIFKVETVNSV